MRRTNENWWWQYCYLWLFSNFYPNHSKNAHRKEVVPKPLRGKNWKALSASKTVSPSPEHRLNRSKHSCGGWTLILSCCKCVLVQQILQNLWAGGEQTRNRALAFAYWDSPPKFYAYVFWYNLQPWGKELLPARCPSQKATCCTWQEAWPCLCPLDVLCSQTADAGNTSQHSCTPIFKQSV